MQKIKLSFDPKPVSPMVSIDDVPKHSWFVTAVTADTDKFKRIYYKGNSDIILSISGNSIDFYKIGDLVEPEGFKSYLVLKDVELDITLRFTACS